MKYKVINADCLDVMQSLSKEGFFRKLGKQQIYLLELCNL